MIDAQRKELSVQISELVKSGSALVTLVQAACKCGSERSGEGENT